MCRNLAPSQPRKRGNETKRRKPQLGTVVIPTLPASSGREGRKLRHTECACYFTPLAAHEQETLPSLFTAAGGSTAARAAWPAPAARAGLGERGASAASAPCWFRVTLLHLLTTAPRRTRRGSRPAPPFQSRAIRRDGFPCRYRYGFASFFLGIFGCAETAVPPHICSEAFFFGSGECQPPARRAKPAKPAWGCRLEWKQSSGQPNFRWFAAGSTRWNRRSRR